MKYNRRWVMLASAGLVASTVASTASLIPGAAASSAATQSPAAQAAAKQRSQPVGQVPATAPVSFDLVLSLRNAAGAAQEVKAVTDPASAQFHHYLTDAQWEATYGPTQATIHSAEAWLKNHGFSVGALPSDQLYVSATGTAAQVEKAFSTSLGYYKVNGKTVRLASGTLTIPSGITGAVTGVVGVNQNLANPDDQEPPPPAAFANPQPCGAYWGQKIDTKDSPSLYAPYTSPLPYDICGYEPWQLRSAYGVGKVHDGTGVGVAIVDAYDTPTILTDAQKYFSLNDSGHPLSSSQFTDVRPATVDDTALCSGSGWFAEQALDVEAVHSMAPGAHIVYVGAQDCLDSSLLAAVGTAITSGASVVTDSWGDTIGDLLDDAANKTAFDNTFMMAGATGVSVLFSSGDYGDNFAISGLTAPDYPASSPFVTAVGGTTLEVNASGARAAEYGWSTAKEVLCTRAHSTNCGSATTPLTSLNWQVGGGGGTSYYYTQPYYQAPVVPSALALRNENIFGPQPLRVIPDIAMDADAQSGMQIGLTETFPNGTTAYGQFKEGGTSLASPLLAGVIADTDQAAGVSLGFLNPVLYKAYTAHPGAFNDVNAPAKPDSAAVIRVDYLNTVDSSNGYVVSLRTINYAGPETYCDATGNCATRNVTLTATPGFDSLTGLGSVGPFFVSVLSKY
jgi:subtilase family serine protease